MAAPKTARQLEGRFERDRGTSENQHFNETESWRYDCLLPLVWPNRTGAVQKFTFNSDIYALSPV